MNESPETKFSKLGAMFHGETRTDRASQEGIRIDLEVLGFEARSILRSIRTEHSKLCQLGQVSSPDLPYFKARFNYYRLSLMRLDPYEKSLLEPVLNKFRDRIAEVEKGDITPNTEISLSSKSEATENEKFVEPESDARSISLKEIAEELHLVEIALMAECSAERNQTIRRAVEKIRKNILKN